MRIKLPRLRIPFLTQRLDLYVIGEVIGPFLGGVVFFSFVFLMFQALRLADFFIIHGISGLMLGKMVMLLILSFLPMGLPIAFLIGILVAFGRLSADSELIAMKANGISVWRLSAPILILSAGVVILSLGLNLSWVPAGDREFRSTLLRVSNTKVISSIKEGTFTSGFFDLLIYADRLDTETNRLHNVFLYDEREPKNPLTVIAREGEIVSVRTATEFGTAAMLKLYNGNIHRSEASTGTYQKIDFGEYRLFLKVDEGIDAMSFKPRVIPYKLLQEQIAGSPDGPRKRELIAELWRRYSIAVSPLLFVFLGIGFGTVRTRAVRAGAALVALSVIVVYWSVQAFGTVAAQKGWIPPPLAMSIPNILIALVGARAFRSASW